ncbi:hypothetical protein K402DRAFT_465474 [Aulographum hederae CBS 113979]|uniref:Uncharacterized protein n=1 Tax=Aulographum hederae CBS 113979 TaxID=1176131 RepID=A0A6G1GTG1_9PEZI|nr:hypothetical protein K402DRAFT_465474 [Aulographum hederae CBS 113979]
MSYAIAREALARLPVSPPVDRSPISESSEESEDGCEQEGGATETYNDNDLAAAQMPFDVSLFEGKGNEFSEAAHNGYEAILDLAWKKHTESGRVDFEGELVGDNGELMTHRELQMLGECMRKYLADDAYAATVDEWVDEPSYDPTDCVLRGARKYLGYPTEKKLKDGLVREAWQPRESRKTTLTAFCDALDERLLNVSPQDLDGEAKVPLRRPAYSMLVEGITKIQVLQQSSDWLMNLAEAICGVEWDEQYSIQTFVIYFIWDPPQAFIADILFTTIASGFSKLHRGRAPLQGLKGLEKLTLSGDYPNITAEEYEDFPTNNISEIERTFAVGELLPGSFTVPIMRNPDGEAISPIGVGAKKGTHYPCIAGMRSWRGPEN